MGKLFTDRGYLGKDFFEDLWNQVLQIRGCLQICKLLFNFIKLTQEIPSIKEDDYDFKSKVSG
jgi:hypothetical protein